MPTAENAKLVIEAAQNLVAFAALTNSGDNLKYTSPDKFWSNRSAFEPIVRPDGVTTGGAMIPTTVDDEVSLAAASFNQAGVEKTVAAKTNQAIGTRPTASQKLINSIVIDAAGAYDVVDGLVSTGDAFSTVRGAAGGPPFIPVGEIEVGQMHLESDSAGPLLASEVKQIVGDSIEKSNFPLSTIDFFNGEITFFSALPLSHTASVTKLTFAQYYTPTFVTIPQANNVVPPEESFSVNSVQNYDGVVASVGKSLNQGTFDALLDSGHSDLLVSLKGLNLWFKFFSNKVKSLNTAFQGVLGIARSFPADTNIAVSCTVSSAVSSTDRDSDT